MENEHDHMVRVGMWAERHGYTLRDAKEPAMYRLVRGSLPAKPQTLEDIERSLTQFDKLAIRPHTGR